MTTMNITPAIHPGVKCERCIAALPAVRGNLARPEMGHALVFRAEGRTAVCLDAVQNLCADPET